MNVTKYESRASNTTVSISIPEGRRIRGRVKPLENVESFEDQVHHGKPHKWHEMLHYGQPGTGFAQCLCGAIGIPYRLPRRRSHA